MSNEAAASHKSNQSLRIPKNSLSVSEDEHINRLPDGNFTLEYEDPGERPNITKDMRFNYLDEEFRITHVTPGVESESYYSFFVSAQKV